MTHTTSPTVADFSDVDTEGLRTLIGQAIAELAELLPLLQELKDTRQRGLAGMTLTGRRVRDAQLRKDRAARLPNLKAGITITGDVDAPVNVAAVSLHAQLHDELATLVVWMRRRSAAAGVCHIRRPPAAPTARQLLTEIRDLADLSTSRRDLLTVTRTLQGLTGQVGNLVHADVGDSQEPCPHCGRHSLVVYLGPGVIRCEPDGPCVCDEPYCGCPKRPHEWYRAAPPDTPQLLRKSWKSTTRSWQGLARAQAAARFHHHATDTTEEPPTS